MNTKEKKKLKLKYLRKIDYAIEQERSKKSVEPNLIHIGLLQKLRNFIQDLDYKTFIEIKSKLPHSLYHNSYSNEYPLPMEMDKFLNDSLTQRVIAFKILDI